MHELTGSVDDRGRPLLRLRLPGKDDELLVIVDTAFTGELLLSETDALTWGVLVLNVEADVELGDGSTVVVKQGLVTIDWLGTLVDATVQVTTSAAPPKPRVRSDGEPVGLLGTAMLREAVIQIDFPQQHLRLSRQ